MIRSKDGMRCFLLRPTLYGAGDELFLMGECVGGLALDVALFSLSNVDAFFPSSVDGCCFSGDGVGITFALLCFACGLLSLARLSVDPAAGTLSSCGSG